MSIEEAFLGVDDEEKPKRDEDDRFSMLRRAYSEILGQPTRTSAILSQARGFVERRMEQLTAMKGKTEERDENVDEELNAELRIVDLAMVKRDKFKNFRLSDDGDFEGGRINDLMESMRKSGLHVPVIVVQRGDLFFERAGSRRIKCARALGWKKIAAVVLSSGVSEVDQCWTNIIENSARKQLSPYEIAKAAQRMRDDYAVKPAEFALRAGYSESYINNLVKIVDKLPGEVLDYWRRNNRPSVDRLRDMTSLHPSEAMKRLRQVEGLSPREMLGGLRKGQRQSKKPGSAASLDRMMKLHAAVEMKSDLPGRAQQLALQCIEFCMASRNKVPGVYEPSGAQKRREAEERRTALAEMDLPNLLDGDEDGKISMPDMDDDGRKK